MSDQPIPPDDREIEIRAANARMARKLGWIMVGMVAFAAINVPLFRLVCLHTGLFGGAYTGSDAALAAEHDQPTGREVAVRFLGTVNGGIPLAFGPKVPAMLVTVGKTYKILYDFTNLTDHPEEIQAVHDIAPADAASSFTKFQCFCFTQQTLAPHEHKEMPVVFRIEPSLPKGDNSLTLSYTLFDLHPAAKG